MWGCGNNTLGQQGSGDSLTGFNTFTKRADNISLVTCSDDTTWYVTNDNKLYGCGYNASGQQGISNTTYVRNFTKRAENALKAVCSDTLTLYITKSNDLYYTGYLGGYQYGGNEAPDGISSFTLIESNIKDTVTAYDHYFSYDTYNEVSMGVTWYLTTSSELFGMGYNDSGQQGNNTTSTVLEFTKRP